MAGSRPILSTRARPSISEREPSATIPSVSPVSASPPSARLPCGEPAPCRGRGRRTGPVRSDHGRQPARAPGRRPADDGRGRPAGQPGPRRPGHEPGPEAGQAAPPVTARDRPGDRRRAGPGRSGRSGRHPDPLGRRRPAGFHQHAPGRSRRSTPSWPGSWPIPPAGDGSRCPPEADQRRVRFGQPDRPAHDRQCPGGVRRRRPVPDPRGGWPSRRPRVLLQRCRRPDPQARRDRPGDPDRPAGPRGWLPRRLHRSPRGGPARFRPRGGRSTRRRSRRHHRALGRRRGPDGDRGEPGPSRSPLRCLEERRLAPHRGLGRACGRAAPGGRASSTSRTARPGSARRPSATTRTG